MRLARMAVAVGSCAVLLSGCGNDVTEPQISNAPVRTADPQKFREALKECLTVSDDQIAEAVGGEAADKGFYGAICRWTVSGATGTVEVTFNWFESGSLDGERNALEKLGYRYEDIGVQSWKSIQAQPPNDPNSCGVTSRAPDAGIVGWWVQFRPSAAHPDPCEAAVELMKLTLNVAR